MGPAAAEMPPTPGQPITLVALTSPDLAPTSPRRTSDCNVAAAGERLDRLVRVQHDHHLGDICHAHQQRARTRSRAETQTPHSPAPICRPHPTPAVAMQLGADQLPSGRRAMTMPEPAFPEKTNPALRMVNTARPNDQHGISARP